MKECVTANKRSGQPRNFGSGPNMEKVSEMVRKSLIDHLEDSRKTEHE
jgi:hypothetical protein